MNKLLFGVGAVILVGVVGYGVYQNKNMMPQENSKAVMMQDEKDAATAKKEAEMSTGNLTPEQTEAMKATDVMKKDNPAMMEKVAGMYVPYSADKLALAKDNKVVIFFHAPWCPTCRALDAELSAQGAKEGYVILKTDYDTSKELRAKYGVTSQHTLVQVDTTGRLLSKWTGGDLTGIYTKAK